jgi:hypothetical protein
MKTIFDKKTREELIDRVNSINGNCKAMWGKMNTWQMVKHCILSEEMYLGKQQYKRLFIGRLFGKMALKGILKDESLMKHNQPTHPVLKIKGNGDVETEKRKWILLLEQYSKFFKQELRASFFWEYDNRTNRALCV